MESPNNLFLRLHKWAARQDENFVTESFAIVLQQLLEEEPETAVSLLKRITNGFLAVSPAEAKFVIVSAQVVLSEGRPDLSVRTSNELVFLEIKVESELGTTQLRRYRRLLKESGVARTGLFLLTRYPVSLSELDEPPDGMVRWYDVAEALDQEVRHHALKPVSAFLVRQFVEFLHARGMVMSQVTYELSGGVRALRNLLDMLAEVAATQSIAIRYRSKRHYAGYNLNGAKYWVGIPYDEPNVVRFGTWTRIDKDRAQALGFGHVLESKDAPGGYRWRHELNLEAEDVHFYARSKAGQMQCLEHFLRDCLNAARQIELPTTPAETPPEDESE